LKNDKKINQSLHTDPIYFGPSLGNDSTTHREIQPLMKSGNDRTVKLQPPDHSDHSSSGGAAMVGGRGFCAATRHADSEGKYLPDATFSVPDVHGRCPPWRRMVSTVVASKDWKTEFGSGR
jgi:hypothetical protein